MLGVLALLCCQLGWAVQTDIYRYPAYNGCDSASGTVTFNAVNGMQHMVLNLRLPPNVTGFIQVHTGVTCFDPFLVGAIWQDDELTYEFEANEHGVVNSTIPYKNVTTDSLMGRAVVVLLDADNSTQTQRVGCGNVGLNYPASMTRYPGDNSRVRGSVAVTGPLTGSASSSPNEPTMLQLVFALSGLPPSATGTIQVFSGNSCSNVSSIGSLWGTNWTSTYTSDASGNALGHADITFVSPSRGVQDYMDRTVVIHDANNNPIACGKLGCPASTVEQGKSMNMVHGKCMPDAVWVNSTLIASDFFSVSNPVQVQVSGVGFSLNYADVRSYPACGAAGQAITTTYFLQQAGGTVQSVLGSTFIPTQGTKHIVLISDKQPESVGRLDNLLVMNFSQSVEPNVHDVVHLGVGVDDVIFRVAAAGHRASTRLQFGEHSNVAFPQSETAVNTTVWVTNAATNAILYQKEFLFGKNSPNFVWFFHGWDSKAPDCKGYRNCANTPLTVTSWPSFASDYGTGVIPNTTQFGSPASAWLPSFAMLAGLIALF